MFGDVGEQISGLVGLHPGEAGEYLGLVGEDGENCLPPIAGLVGLQVGELGLKAGEAGLKFGLEGL